MMYGSEYSLIRLQASFEERFSRLAEWVPAKLTTWILNYASAPPDEFGEILRADSGFRLALERELPSLELTSTYFCSELVVAMLVHAGLLHEEASVARITPSSLYDRLLNDGWQDATTGCAGLLNRWQESNRTEWENRYLSAVGFAAVARQQHLTAAAIDAIERQHNSFNASLEGIINRLSLLWVNSLGS